MFEELAGRDVTLEISLSNGVTWTVNGQDIPENADLTDLDLGVTLDASTIPVSVVNTITGAVDTIQISLKHDGEFGFTMTRRSLRSPTRLTTPSSSTPTAMSRWGCPSPMCRRATGPMTPSSTSTARA